jgi:hypothetical protein
VSAFEASVAELRAIFDDFPDAGFGTTVIRRDFAEEVVRRWWHLTRAQFRDLRRRARLTYEAQHR